MSELKITSEQAVALLIAELDRNILRIEYDFTFLKCQTALNLKAQANEVKKRILEIAYWYTETDSAQAAIKTLNLIKQTGLSAISPKIIRNLQFEISAPLSILPF